MEWSTKAQHIIATCSGTPKRGESGEPVDDNEQEMMDTNTLGGDFACRILNGYWLSTTMTALWS